ncbi:MAG: SIS domain-containing protein [Coriobacteriales bacterium]|nr:SIS domain-containing protein [Coriobacteriales bacterium]
MKLAEEARRIVAQVIAWKEPVGGLNNVVWVAAGGSNGGNYPAQYFMEHEATQLMSHAYTSNEFVHATPKFVGQDTLAVVVSMRGTPETIEAARVANELGAATVAVYVDESALTEVCDLAIKYDSLAVDESDMGRTNSAVVLALAMELVQQTEGYDHYDKAMPAFDLIEPIYRKAFEYCQPLAREWALQNSDRPTVNVMGSGPAFGAAYVFSICNVQEMLQIDSVTTNCCEFFHGPFEILDKRTSVFLLMGVGRSRANDERALDFLNTYGGRRVYVLDGKELGLNDLDDAVSEYFNHLIFSPILNNVYMRALSAVTHKDYMTRRYMWKVQY